eukprot:361670-Chlamydomonas_euryale.AAC.6
MGNAVAVRPRAPEACTPRCWADGPVHMHGMRRHAAGCRGRPGRLAGSFGKQFTVVELILENIKAS